VAKPLRERPRIHKNCGSCERSARAYPIRASWDTVFDGLYGAYERGLRRGFAARKRIRTRWRPAADSPGCLIEE